MHQLLGLLFLQWKIMSQGPEILNVSVISTFSPLPSNIGGRQIKIRDSFIDLPKELIV